METKFEPGQFTATQWDSQADKAKFANHFVRFVRSGFKQTLFPKWFYTRLSNTFGHIAHYDIGGFYATFFQDTEGKLSFLRQCAAFPCYGDPEYTYSDVEKALMPFIREILRDYVTLASQEHEARERAEFERLSLKFGNKG